MCKTCWLTPFSGIFNCCRLAHVAGRATDYSLFGLKTIVKMDRETPMGRQLMFKNVRCGHARAKGPKWRTAVNLRPIFSFWWMWTSKPDTSVQVKKHILNTFVINPLFHICQKKKIALEMADKFASVNGPYFYCNLS